MNNDKCSSETICGWVMALLFSVLLVGCGSDSSNSSGYGTFSASLTDAPACGFDAVNVTVEKVRVHQSVSASENDAGWSDITLSPARKINLLSLNNGLLDHLGEIPLAAGHYTQLRLVLDANTGSSLANSVVPTGGVETTLGTPSAAHSGIKLINEFDVVSGQRVDLVLDFNACKSVVTSGSGTYKLKPVIKVIPFVLNGIYGFVDPLLLGSNVLVTAQQNGVIAQSTAPNEITGEFYLTRIAPGNYDVVITANGHATAIIASVPVASIASTVVVSTSSVPITLPNSASHSISGTETLNPSSSTVVAYAAAHQAVGTLPVVTVQSQAADLLSGAYMLTLPIGPPQLGQYSATLPIVFVDGAFVVGQYTDVAYATGYTTQSFIENISTTDVTQNFILVP